PFRVLGVWLVAAIAVLGVQHQVGGSAIDRFRVPGVESQRATDVLQQRFKMQSGPSGQIVFHVEHGTLSEPANEATIKASLQQLSTAPGAAAAPARSDPRGPTISADGRTAFATVNYTKPPLTKVNTRQALAAAETARRRGVQAELTGSIASLHGVEGK